MLPENKLSKDPIDGDFMVPEKVDELEDYSLHFSSREVVRCYYEGQNIRYSHMGVVYDVLTVPDLTALSFTLDQNLRPLLVYVQNKKTYMYWFNSAIGKMEVKLWGEGYLTPQVALDDLRIENSSQIDIIFAYIKDENLCIRYQRDRFTTETVLGPSDRLFQIGALNNHRFGFKTFVRVKPTEEG